MIIRHACLNFVKFKRPVLLHSLFKMSTVDKPVEQSIVRKLEELDPVHLEVVNESYMHNVPKGSETHFKVFVVSSKFDGVPLLSRHRMVNSLLSSELSSGVHALSIVAKTPTQWTPDEKVTSSPRCLGGFGK